MKRNNSKENQSYPSDEGKGVDGIVATDASTPNESLPNVQGGDSSSAAGRIQSVPETAEKTKTSVAATLVSGQSSPSGGNAGAMTRGVVFGGGAGTDIGTDVSATTRADGVYKSGTRIGKRQDPITRKIDFVYPELFETEIRQSKPLSETTAKQGYRDNYYNQHTITQRTSGGAPADVDFDRSIDLITLDMGYFADGQYNTARQDYGEYAVRSWDPEANHGAGAYSLLPITQTRGNYLGHDLIVCVNQQGAVSMEFTESDLSNRGLDEAVSRCAGDAALRTVNRRELDRLQMVNLAGNDSDPKYSPLGDQIVTATSVNHWLADLDAFAGDNIFVSERKLSHALAFQVNKVGKDGLRITGPMAEMLNGNIEGENSTAISPVREVMGREIALMNRDVLCRGGAGLWLAMNDSLAKYTTKGKLLALPLSFRNALTVAQNNDQPFRMHETLARDIKHAELFSTIDMGYDPLKPVVATDKLAIIHPMSLAATGNTEKITVDSTAMDTHVPELFTYHYESWRNKVNVPVYSFFMAGLLDYFKANAGRIWDAFIRRGGDDRYNEGTTPYLREDGIVQIVIPIQSSLTSLSLWDLFVCSAIPYMVRHRQLVLCDVIKYEKNFGYPYSGIVPMKEQGITDALNFSFTDVDHMLDSRIANPIDAIKVKFPELFWTIGAAGHEEIFDDTTLGVEVGQTVLPFYFSDAQFSHRSDDQEEPDSALALNDRANTINYPSTRSGVNLKDMDSVYGMTEEDFRLALDRMVVYPGYTRIPAAADAENSTVIGLNEQGNYYEASSYKYGITSEGIPVIPYVVAVESNEDKIGYENCLTILDVMRTPREMGLHFVMPSGVLTPVRDEDGVANYRDVESGYLGFAGPGFTAYFWHADNIEVEQDILDEAQLNLQPNEAYANTWQVHQTIPTNERYDYGFVFGISHNIDVIDAHEYHAYSLDDGSLDFIPFVQGVYGPVEYEDTEGVYPTPDRQVNDATGLFSVISFQKYFWTRLQRLPFVVNPFDANASDLTYDALDIKGNKYDIFDYLYFFNFCGFRGSDYTELAYDRHKSRIALGMNYINDPYVEKSLLLK